MWSVESVTYYITVLCLWLSARREFGEGNIAGYLGPAKGH